MVQWLNLLGQEFLEVALSTADHGQSQDTRLRGLAAESILTFISTREVLEVS